MLCRFSPLTTYYRTFPQMPEELQREWALLDTHDTLTDWYKHFRTATQIQAGLAALGGISIRCDLVSGVVEASCRRPPETG